MCYIIYDSSDNFFKVFRTLSDLVSWLDFNNNYFVEIYFINLRCEFVHFLESIEKFDSED